MMAEHRAQNQLDIQHENREQRQGEQAGPPLVEFDPRLFLDPFWPVNRAIATAMQKKV